VASTTSVDASSATYRKAVNKIAQELREPAHHTKFPSDDFDAIADLIDPQSRKRALEWYKRGIRRGFIEACDAVLDGQLKLKNKTLLCPPKVTISIRVKFKGQRWAKKTFTFEASELEFI